MSCNHKSSLHCLNLHPASICLPVQPYWHRRCRNRPVSDACAGRSTWQMLDSESLAVTHTAHILIHTLWESQCTKLEKWQSSSLPHICLFHFLFSPTYRPASPLPFLLHCCWFLLFCQHTGANCSWSSVTVHVGFYGLLLSSLTGVKNMTVDKTSDFDVGHEAMIDSCLFWLNPCENSRGLLRQTWKSCWIKSEVVYLLVFLI